MRSWPVYRQVTGADPLGRARPQSRGGRPGPGTETPMAPMLGTVMACSLGPWSERREQAEGAGLLDGLTAVVCAELVVQVTHVRPDGVHRQRQLTSDLRR